MKKLKGPESKYGKVSLTNFFVLGRLKDPMPEGALRVRVSSSPKKEGDNGKVVWLIREKGYSGTLENRIMPVQSELSFPEFWHRGQRVNIIVGSLGRYIGSRTVCFLEDQALIDEAVLGAVDEMRQQLTELEKSHGGFESLKAREKAYDELMQSSCDCPPPPHFGGVVVRERPRNIEGQEIKDALKGLEKNANEIRRTLSTLDRHSEDSMNFAIALPESIGNVPPVAFIIELHRGGEGIYNCIVTKISYSEEYHFSFPYTAINGIWTSHLGNRAAVILGPFLPLKGR